MSDPSRFLHMLAGAGALALATQASAQPWTWQAGGAARAEFNDNYFFTSDARDSAFVGSIAPFVSGARRAETSEITAFLGVAGNKVWGASAARDYGSGRAAVTGSQWDAVSTVSGSASYSRLPSLQNTATPGGIVQTRAVDDFAAIDGAYSRALSERWSAGATVKAYSHRYDDLGTGATFQNNWAWQAGGTTGYAVSQQTQVALALLYSHLASEIERSDAITATLGIAHEVSPELTLSASGGGYWLKSDTARSAFACAPGSDGCGDEGTRVRSRHDGGLYGGSVRWGLREGSTLLATVSDVLAPTGTGALSRSAIAALSVVQTYSERLTGRLAAGYTKTTFPTVATQSTERSYAAEVGINYELAEGWTLDAGYRYVRTDYSGTGQNPRSNVIFLNVAYAWSQAPAVRWTPPQPDYGALPGAGPVPLRQHPTGAPDLAAPQPVAPDLDRSPFDPWSLP